MMENQGHSRAARFGPFELDLVTGELLRAGLKQHLQVQAFRVLAELVKRPGELVTRDELRHALWPDDVFVDVEHGLNVVIAKLRRTLGDGVETPHYIETLERRGYRFLAPVEWVDGPSVHASSPPSRTIYVCAGEQQFTLGEGVHVIGRDPFCAVWVDSKAVSRRHASLTITPHGIVLADLGSRNGTFVNGQRAIVPVLLAQADEIRLGTVRMVVRHETAMESTTADEPLQVTSG
jgi:DNA-binding winged helix-turn-helix (wHTH) protein